MMEEFNLTKKIYRRKTIKRVKNKINLLGEDKIDINIFLISRLVLTLLLFLVLLFFKIGIIISPIISLIFYISYEYILLDIKVKRKINVLEEEAPYFLGILNATLKVTNSFKIALELTVKNLKSNLSKEFSRVLKENELGKSMVNCLTDMQKRIPSNSIKNFLLNICETLKAGGDLQQTLDKEIELLQEKQIMKIKTHVAKIPVKFGILTILLIVPVIFLIIYGPTILNNLLS